jgi:hypothetical protein
LSSASLAEYHVKKLLDNGLIRESGGGYVTDGMFFENMVKFGRWVFPFQWAYALFFATSLILLLTIMRPVALNEIYLYSIVIDLAGLGMSIYEASRIAKPLFRK